MYKERIIAWGCGIAALLLVIMAGKSCTGTPQTSKKETSTSIEATDDNNSNSYNIITPDMEIATENEIIEYDIFGRPITATAAPTEPMAEIPTDEEGNPLEVPTEDITVDATASAEPTDELSTEAATDEPVVEDGGEDATQPATIPPGLSGYDHKVYDDEGNEKATIPPDFVIIIE